MDGQRSIDLARRMVDAIFLWYTPDRARWRYEDGLFLLSVLSLAEATGDTRLAERVRDSYNTLVKPDGVIAGYSIEEYSLDHINAGRILFDLHRLYGDERYVTAAGMLALQLRYHPRNLGGGFWHKRIYPWQIWLDGLYMAQPFRCRYALMTGESGLFADVVSQMAEIEKHTRDSRTGLLYHAWDESLEQLWADPKTGCSPHFWARAMGWYCMALVDVLEYLPRETSGWNELSAIVERTARAVAAWQDASGLWYQILDQGGRDGNYLESSASAMFVYFLLKATRMGLLSDGAVSEKARRGFDALVSLKTRSDGNGGLHLHDICSVAGLGGEPYRDGSYAYYVSEPVATDDFKGVGPFVLAALEIAR